MHFVIHCLDKPGSASIRKQHFEDHKIYIATAPVSVVISGPLVSEDGQTPVGSLFVVEAASHAEVERMNQGDPFFKAGLWDRIAIHQFLKRVDNRG